MTEKQIEIELKLRIDPKHVARLKNAPVLREVKKGRRLLTTHLVSIYHDTPELLLAEKGLAVRLRKKGARGWEQTVKAANGLREALPERNEWTVELEEGVLDLDRFTDQDVKKLLSNFVKNKNIERIFESDIKRSAVDLTYHDTTMELAIDQGVVRSGKKEVAISEVEFELKEGHPAALFDLALELQRTVPLLLSMRSKGARGRDLYLGKEPDVYRAAPVALTPDMSAETAFRLVLAQGLRMILSNEVCVRQDIDVEGCHQMQAGMCHLRAALCLFEKVLPVAETVLLCRLLKQCSKGLDRLRDWDVFLGEILPVIEERFPDHAGGGELRNAAEQQRKAALATARKMLKQPEYGQLLLLLGAWASYSRWASGASEAQMKMMTAPVSEMIELLLGPVHDRVTKRSNHIADLSVPQLHALCLDVKQMRYGTELFGVIYDAKKVRKFGSKLIRTEKILGELQDAARTEACLMMLAPQLSEDAMVVVGLISDSLGVCADDKSERLQLAIQKSSDQKPFWG